ncbi:MAG: cupredoxin domain-containing protein [Proteobacteria bacterium]|nr:cupredoxin domain-containing protein [Pseudomonadota bacterium]
MLKRSLIVAIVLALGAPTAIAANAFETVIVIKDHRFQPDEIKVPAGQQLKLVIDNQDATPEEFESHNLRIEKIVPGNSKATIRIEPLKAGEYRFVGEFNEDTAKGKLVAE